MARVDEEKESASSMKMLDVVVVVEKINQWADNVSVHPGVVTSSRSVVGPCGLFAKAVANGRRAIDAGRMQKRRIQYSRMERAE
jgi:3-oxoacyl-(acyl-carrier-protein) synthase